MDLTNSPSFLLKSSSNLCRPFQSLSQFFPPLAFMEIKDTFRGSTKSLFMSKFLHIYFYLEVFSEPLSWLWSLSFVAPQFHCVFFMAVFHFTITNSYVSILFPKLDFKLLCFKSHAVAIRLPIYVMCSIGILHWI